MLSMQTNETVVHTFVSSRFDYCNCQRNCSSKTADRREHWRTLQKIVCLPLPNEFGKQYLVHVTKGFGKSYQTIVVTVTK